MALLFVGYGVFRYRRGGSSRSDLLLALLIAAGVALISLLPQVGEIFVRLFGLENRAFALLSWLLVRSAEYRVGILERIKHWKNEPRRPFLRRRRRPEDDDWD